MNIDKQAKILLEYGSWKNYIEKAFERCNVNEEYIIDEIQECTISKMPPHSIRENWDTEKEFFLEDGYTHDDIIYDTEDEAYEQNIEDVLEEVAWVLCSKCFSGDFFHQRIVNYLRYYV